MRQGILFSITEMLRELESAEKLATPFLENPQSFFGEVRTQLIGIRDEPTDGEISWEVPLVRSSEHWRRKENTKRALRAGGLQASWRSSGKYFAFVRRSTNRRQNNSS
jgi:hypothetical protein